MAEDKPEITPQAETETEKVEPTNPEKKKNTVKIGGVERNIFLFIVEIIFVVIFPPVTVIIEKGCGFDLLLNVILLLLGWIPAIIHAIFILLMSKKEAAGLEDLEKGKTFEKK